MFSQMLMEFKCADHVSSMICTFELHYHLAEHLWIYSHHQSHHPSWADFLSGWPASSLDDSRNYSYWPASSLDDLCSYSHWPASSLDDLCNYSHWPASSLDDLCNYSHWPASSWDDMICTTNSRWPVSSLDNFLQQILINVYSLLCKQCNYRVVEATNLFWQWYIATVSWNWGSHCIVYLFLQCIHCKLLRDTLVTSLSRHVLVMHIKGHFGKRQVKSFEEYHDLDPCRPLWSLVSCSEWYLRMHAFDCAIRL